ncbi:MAG TPA: hypothetical protein VIX73_21220 [Kofleriaceae bacterium]|jgi:hypothetical protein
MTRNQFAKDITKFSTNPIFTVDGNGNVTPTDLQLAARGGSVMIKNASSSLTHWTGYVCMWDSGCHCQSTVDNLNGLPHMKVNENTAYNIKSNAPLGDYEVYAVSDSGVPIANATNGTVRIGAT